jgi:hypothetical protein
VRLKNIKGDLFFDFSLMINCLVNVNYWYRLIHIHDGEKFFLLKGHLIDQEGDGIFACSFFIWRMGYEKFIEPDQNHVRFLIFYILNIGFVLPQI